MLAADSTTPPRTVIEFCTSTDSELCAAKYQKHPADTFHRLTIFDDLTTVHGLRKTLRIVSEAKGYISLHGSLPCTGGSPWWHMILLKNIGAEILHQLHRDKIDFLLTHFEVVA